jgi:hypothetical protein
MSVQMLTLMKAQGCLRAVVYEYSKYFHSTMANDALLQKFPAIKSLRGNMLKFMESQLALKTDVITTILDNVAKLFWEDFL